MGNGASLPGFDSSSVIYNVTRSKSLSLSRSRFSHLFNRDNDITFFIESLWGLCELIFEVFKLYLTLDILSITYLWPLPQYCYCVITAIISEFHHKGLLMLGGHEWSRAHALKSTRKWAKFSVKRTCCSAGWRLQSMRPPSPLSLQQFSAVPDVMNIACTLSWRPRLW